jgi:hypothetical protein
MATQPNYWTFVRDMNARGVTITRCDKHDLGNCASCAGHDDLAEALPGARVTPRTLRPGITAGEARFGNTWDTHSPFYKCGDPSCCDDLDTLRRQAGDSFAN